MTHFLAFEVTQVDNIFSRGVVSKQTEKLVSDQVRINVEYSDINYKDALAASKNSNVIREYPKVPGIDLAGTISQSNSLLWKVGERVLVTGFGLGVAKDGGFSQIQDVPASWPVALPEDLSAKEAMAFGTAGFTAALCVQALIKQKIASEASILVTGASGGVASIAIALLKELGFTNITALSAKNEQETYLSALGAQKILKPEELLPEKNRPLAKEKFAAVIDTVGGDMLAAILPFMQYDGCVALCGNAAGNQLNTTVLPFILRNIRLIGIDSVNVKQEKRRAIWEFLAKHKKILNKIQVQEVILTDLDDTIEAILDARHVGRTIVEMEVKK